MIKFKKGGIVEQIITFKTRWTYWGMNDWYDGCEALKKLIINPIIALLVGGVIGSVLCGLMGIYFVITAGLEPEGFMNACTFMALIICLTGGLFLVAVLAVVIAGGLIYLTTEAESTNSLRNNISEYYHSFKDKYCPKITWKD